MCQAGAGAGDAKASNREVTRRLLQEPWGGSPGWDGKSSEAIEEALNRVFWEEPGTTLCR